MFCVIITYWIANMDHLWNFVLKQGPRKTPESTDRMNMEIEERETRTEEDRDIENKG